MTINFTIDNTTLINSILLSVSLISAIFYVAYELWISHLQQIMIYPPKMRFPNLSKFLFTLSIVCALATLL